MKTKQKVRFENETEEEPFTVKLCKNCRRSVKFKGLSPKLNRLGKRKKSNKSSPGRQSSSQARMVAQSTQVDEDMSANREIRPPKIFKSGMAQTTISLGTGDQNGMINITAGHGRESAYNTSSEGFIQHSAGFEYFKAPDTSNPNRLEHNQVSAIDRT